MFTLHHGTVLERSERLFLASGNGVSVTTNGTKYSQIRHKSNIYVVNGNVVTVQFAVRYTNYPKQCYENIILYLKNNKHL